MSGLDRQVGHKHTFTCPICTYRGLFQDVRPVYGYRRWARCPRCGSLERHRLQFAVLDRLLKTFDPAAKSCLQFAPDPMTPILMRAFGHVVTADIDPRPGSVRLDMTAMDLEDESFDLLYASHVLEHIREDMKALSEVRRVLKPGGIAILPVPIVAETSLEYPYTVATEANHLRAPGLDYFDRYRRVFDRVEVTTSDDAPEEYQTYVYEDRTVYPTANCPFRRPVPGERHIDAVPVAFKL